MVSLDQAIRFLFPSARSGIEYNIRDDGAGDYLERWNRPEPQPTAAEIAAAMLPAAKAQRIAQDRQECQRRIYQYWPLQEQITALAGNYEPGGMDSLINWQDLNIRASNTARDIINLQSTDTVAKVEAVPIQWPAWNG